ncbi:hypothetical protein LWM68_20015 [Niabella sp. W65]|nr:hypothetical protein [Niabella sp. W65]MCH7364843.1 hypothetical protein [Niabella sp. W65]
MAGGAVIKGQLLVNEVRDVKIMGRGIIDFSVRGAVQIERSRNILVEGLALTQCPVGGSDSITIKNVKSISYYGWGDGMNVFASNNVCMTVYFAVTLMIAPPYMLPVKGLPVVAAILL